MGLDIVTNSMAQQASNDLSTNQANMQSSLEKLSSGYEINTAADDASGLVISQHLQAQIGAFQQAQSNTQAGINVVQTASGALSEVSTILQRINTLAVESQNSSATDPTAQQAAQSEVNQALSSITDIAATTVYGNNTLLVNGDNSTVNYTFQTGYDGSTSSQVAFSVTALNLANLGLVSGTLTDGTPNIIGTNGSSHIQSVTGNVAEGTYALQATAAVAASQTGAAAGVSSGYRAGNTTYYMQAAGETFNIQVDGGAAVTVTMGATETAATLTTKINAALTAAGQTGAVTVSNNAGALKVTSNLAGDLGNIAITAAGATTTDTGFATGVGITADNPSVAEGFQQGATVATQTAAGNNFYMTGAGETFAIAVDGGAAVTVNLAGMETAGGVQNLINNALYSAGQTSTVAVANNAGVLSITSGAYGASGSVNITTGVQGATDLGLTAAALAAGTVAGTNAQIGFGTAGNLNVVSLSNAQNQAGSNVSISFGTSSSVDVALNGKVVTTAAQTLTQSPLANVNAQNYSVTAATAITQVQNAIATVSSMQGQFGAYQNQLQDISANETTGIQNLTASNANIMDTNMASQMVNFTQDQVLVQAGVSMLAQANQIPQYVLKLLG
jgi:flagellin